MKLRPRPTKNWYATCICGVKLTAVQWLVVCLTGCPVCETITNRETEPF